MAVQAAGNCLGQNGHGCYARLLPWLFNGRALPAAVGSPSCGRGGQGYLDMSAFSGGLGDRSWSIAWQISLIKAAILGFPSHQEENLVDAFHP
jgi:hypothetical protein